MNIKFLDDNSLSKSCFANWRYLIAIGIYLAAAQGVYIFSLTANASWGITGKDIFWILTSPVLLAGFLDFRLGLLISIVATPIFNIPLFPHLFTQGLGDFFALMVVLGFLVFHHRRLVTIFCRPQAYIILIPASALVSIFFNFDFIKVHQWAQFKFEIAEFLGLSVAVFYALILAAAVRNKNDLRILIFAFLSSLIVAIIQSGVSFVLISYCVGGIDGTIMSSAGQISGGFSNPNYYGSWLLAMFPLILYFSFLKSGSLLKRFIANIVMYAVIFFLVLTVSRSVMLTLVVVLLIYSIWVAKNARVKILMIIGTILFLFPAVWSYRFEMCNLNNASAANFLKINSSSLVQKGKLYDFVDSKALVEFDGRSLEKPIRVQVFELAFAAWKSSLFFGIGPSNLSTFGYNQIGMRGERGHNVLVTILAEQGLFGFLIWIGLWLALFWKTVCFGRGCGDPFSQDATYKKYLSLVLFSLSITSLFADQHRVLWLWQFVGIMVSPYFSGGSSPEALELRSDADY